MLRLLAVANFVIGMGAFVVIGVLVPVATAFAVSKPQAGLLMTVYAIVYALTSPVLVALTGRFGRAQVMLAGLAIFLLGALLASFAPSFEFLLAARAVMAVGGGLVTPVAASIGVMLVAPEQRGRALAVIFGGLTLAQVFGVPLGAWLGYAFGWRMAFEVVAVLALVSGVVLWRMLPREVQVPPTSLKTLGSVLATPHLVLAVSFTACFVGGLYVLYTYMAPFLEARYGLGRDGVTGMLVLFGVGAVLGNWLGGRMTDRQGPTKTLVSLAVVQIMIMPVLTHLPGGVAFGAVMIFLWSAMAWSFMVAQQARLAQLSPAQAPILFALNAAAIYVGGFIGSAIGGRLLADGSFRDLGAGGAGLMALALISVFLVKKLTPPAAAA
ncbi:hypothetical protein IP84_04055 [beta proteobacterium AAP99]|nr:hypothetical protein IP84_04055 [beta proteobacterium AAP99]